MRVKKYLGKEIRLTERDYRTLVRRFDYRNADKKRYIDIRCCLCDKYNNGIRCAEECPFQKYETRNLMGCMWIIKELIKPSRTFPHDVEVDSIRVDLDNRKQIDNFEKVRRFLLSFKKEGRKGKTAEKGD